MNSHEMDFRIISKLGEGSYAEVFKVKSNYDGNFYAIKRLKKRYRSIEEVNRLPEVLYLRQLQGHPNVIELKDILYDQNNGYVSIVFELMDCNLYELLSDHKKPFEEDIALLFIYQLLLSIKLLHSKNMFHRDVKPENCMVNKETYLVKLCDFGSTRTVSSSSPYTEYVSTRWYRAPECILTSGSYGPEVDEWAVGCMFFELLTGKPLFPGRHEIDQISRIHNLLGTPARDVLAQFKRNPKSEINFQFQKKPAQDMRRLLPNTSDDSFDLLVKLLTYSPADRITAADALNHPAFSALNRCYDEWEKKVAPVSKMPFSAFYLKEAHGKSFNEEMFAIGGKEGRLAVSTPSFKKQKIQQQVPKKPLFLPQPPTVKPPNKPLNPILKSKYQFIQKSQFQKLNQSNVNHSNFDQSNSNDDATTANQQTFKVMPPSIDSTRMEARMKAAQRLKEYERMKAGNYASQTSFKKQTVPSMNPAHAAQPSLYKPTIYAPQKNPKQKQVFQMPTPEILKPRLPPQYKIGEQKNQKPSHLPSIGQSNQ